MPGWKWFAKVFPRPPRPRASAALACALGLFFAAGALHPAHGASFRISPTRFEFPLTKRFTNFFTLTNISRESVRVRVYARFVEVGEKNQIIEKVGHPHDLSRWLVFNPRLLTVRPKQRRTIRFSVRPPKGLSAGEYRAVVFFEELPPQVERKKTGGDPNSLSLQLTLLTRVGVTIYGMVGKPHVEVRVSERGVEVGDGTLVVTLLIENAGNAHLPVTLVARLLDSANDEMEKANSMVVIHRAQKHRWEFRTDTPPPGKYRLALSGSSNKKPLFQTEFPFEVGAGQGN